MAGDRLRAVSPASPPNPDLVGVGVGVGVELGEHGFGRRGYVAGPTLGVDVLRDRLHRLGVPILGGLPAGHGDDPPTIPIGTEATIDTAAGTLTVQAAVR
ncbi:hypothetical protein [Nonomuraea sp. JJY05]|uniref:hypothetical protein n=1 Tax=Nonomuraea sp. JJY05 TaxID=3350255 RepID=UPI00373FA17E